MGGRCCTSGLKVLVSGCLWAENISPEGRLRVPSECAGVVGRRPHALGDAWMQAYGRPGDLPAPERREVTQCHCGSHFRRHLQTGPSIQSYVCVGLMGTAGVWPSHLWGFPTVGSLRAPSLGFKGAGDELQGSAAIYSLMECPFCLPGQTQSFPKQEAAPFGSICTLTGGSSELPNCPLFPDSDPQAAPCTPFSDPISPLPQLPELSAVLFGSCKLSTSLPCL